MPRGTAEKNHFKLTTGRITEATPLNFPEGSLLDEENVVLEHTGKISRRRGLEAGAYRYPTDYQGQHGYIFSTRRESPSFSYIWESAIGNEDVLLLRMADHLFFYKTSEENINSGYIGFIDLPDSTSPISVSRSRDTLMLCCKDIFLISLSNPVGDVLTLDVEEIEYLRYRKRDKDSSPEDVFVDPMPSELKTDLINQGWPEKEIGINNKGSNPTSSNYNDIPWNAFRDQTASRDHEADEPIYGGVPGYPGQRWPGHYDQYSYYYDDVNQVFDKGEVHSAQQPTSESPRGKIILKMNNFSAGAACFYQGHAVYAARDESSSQGNYTEEANNTLYVSQSIVKDSMSEYSNCHSYNDPTDIVESSPLDTDGGLITINDAADIIHLATLNNILIVFATNGIWAVVPPSDEAFTVGNFSVSKISNEPISSTRGLVEAGGSLFFWANKAIYSIGLGETGLPKLQNITEGTIQKFYNEMPKIQKDYCQGVLSRDELKIFWLYNDTLKSTDGDIALANRCLILDLRTSSFTTYRFNLPGDPGILTAFPLESKTSELNENQVVHGSSQEAVLAGSDQVNIGVSSITYGDTGEILHYVVAEKPFEPYDRYARVAFATATSTDFVDMKMDNSSGYSYDSYFETGHEVLEDPKRSKQITYVSTYFNRTEERVTSDPVTGHVDFDNPSSCYMQYKWEWSNSQESGKWSNKEQVYRLPRNYTLPSLNPGESSSFDYPYDVILSKNKVRGEGKSLRVRFESEEGKDFQMYGWAATYTAEAAP